MNCAKCKSQPMTKVVCSENFVLSHFECPSCSGAFVSGERIDSLSDFKVASVSLDPKDNDYDPKAGLCPNGHGIMERADAGEFHIDKCGHCSGTFFDRGELEKVLATDMKNKIFDLFNPFLQKKAQLQEKQRRYRESIDALYGKQVVDLIDQLADKLDKENASVAVAYLYSQL